MESCGGGGPYLIIEADKAARTFRFLEEAGGQEIAYTKLKYNNKEVYKAVFMEMITITNRNAGTGNGVYFAFDEDDYKVEQVDNQTTITYNGGSSISADLKWKYTLENGVLDISGNGKKIGPANNPGLASTKTKLQKNAHETVAKFISLIKEKKYGEAQMLLTDNYDFIGDTVVFNMENYDTYFGLSEFTIRDREYYEDYCTINIQSRRPDIFDFSNGTDVYDEFHAYSDDEKNAYVKRRFQNGDYTKIEGVHALTLVNRDGEWVIQFDQELVNLMSQTSTLHFVYKNPTSQFQTKIYDSDYFDRKFIREYILNNIKVENEGEYTFVINEGDLGFVSMMLKKEYRDKNGVLLHTRYAKAFDNFRGLSSLSGESVHYLIRPGYLWAGKKENILDELDKYGADPGQSTVSVLDLEMTRAVRYPQLSAELKEFSGKYIRFPEFKISKARNVFTREEDGLTGLSIENTSEREVTKLVILVEFSDDKGTVRAGMAFNILDEGRTIEPNGIWKLSSGEYFSLRQIPPVLIEKNKIQFSIVEIALEIVMK
jgi:hypothetical protein